MSKQCLSDKLSSLCFLFPVCRTPQFKHATKKFAGEIDFCDNDADLDCMNYWLYENLYDILNITKMDCPRECRFEPQEIQNMNYCT